MEMISPTTTCDTVARKKLRLPPIGTSIKTQWLDLKMIEINDIIRDVDTSILKQAQPCLLLHHALDYFCKCCKACVEKPNSCSRTNIFHTVSFARISVDYL